MTIAFYVKDKDVGISGGDRRVALLLAMTIAFCVVRYEIPYKVYRILYNVKKIKYSNTVTASECNERGSLTQLCLMVIRKRGEKS